MKSLTFTAVFAVLIGATVFACINDSAGEATQNQGGRDTILPGKPDTLPALTYLPGQYILDIDELLDVKIDVDRNKGILKGPISLGVKRTYRSLFFANKSTVRNFLNLSFPFLDLQHDDVKKVGESFVVVQLDSAEVQKMRTEEQLETFEQNYILKLDNEPVSAVSQPSEAANWGVVAVSNNIKSNLQSNKKVWVLDSGIDRDHEDLNVDRNLSKSYTSNEYYDLRTPVDAHGTHVAGIIGARANGKGIIGVAPNIGLVAVRVAQGGKVEGNGYLEGLKYIYRTANPGDVVNISLQKTAGSPTEKRSIQDMANRGIHVVIAAGNGPIFPINLDLTPIYPAAITGTNIYTIASHNEQPGYSGFSAYGNAVKYCAPGERILSTLPGNSYGVDEGTSMAAPHVSGLLILNGRVNRRNDILCPRNNQRYPVAHE
jgi:subtilisin